MFVTLKESVGSTATQNQSRFSEWLSCFLESSDTARQSLGEAGTRKGRKKNHWFLLAPPTQTMPCIFFTQSTMLKETEVPLITRKPTPAPTYRRPHSLTPAPVMDPITHNMYDVATLLQELTHPSYANEPLSEKLDIFIDQIIQWADEDAAVSKIKEIHEILFRLRNAFAGVRLLSTHEQDC